MLTDTKLKEDGTPLWSQLADTLRAAIDGGDFHPGSCLPSEAEINEIFGVSRTTTRSAMQQLVNEGLIKRKPGQGTIVVDQRVDPPVSPIRSFSDDMRGRGMVPGYEVSAIGFTDAPLEASQALAISSGDKPFGIRRKLFANSRLIGLCQSYIRPDIFGDVTPPNADTLSSGSLYKWITEKLGANLTRGTEFIEAAIASEAEHEEIGLEVGDPILVARRTVNTGDNQPVEYATIIYRADRYRFRIEL